MKLKRRFLSVFLSVIILISTFSSTEINVFANEGKPSMNLAEYHVSEYGGEEPKENEMQELPEEEDSIAFDDFSDEFPDTEIEKKSGDLSENNEDAEENEEPVEKNTEETDITDIEEQGEKDVEAGDPSEAEISEELPEEEITIEPPGDNVAQIDGADKKTEQKLELKGVYQFGDAPSDSDDISVFSFDYTENTEIAEVEDYLYQQLKARITKVVVNNYNEEFLSGNVISAVLNEHPDLYYVRKSYYESVSYTNHTLTLRFTYDNSLDDMAFKKATAQALSYIKPGMSDLEKVIALHDYLAVNCEYDYENYEAGTIPLESYSAYGVLVNRIAVCQGYALAYKYLLNQAGIECYMVTSNIMLHAWNLVVLDDAYYHVDVTWADPVFDLVGRVQHKYMLRSDEAFTHPDNANTEKHYMWEVTKGNNIINYKAADTRYDNAFWTNCHSPLILENNDCYYISSDQRIMKATLAEPAAEGTDICRGENYIEPGQYSGLFLLDGHLYYNTKTSIYSIGLKGDDGRIVFNADSSKGYLYGCALSQGKVFYAQGYITNFQKVPVWTMDFKDFSSLVPVENITISHEKLVLSVGETALIEASFSPDNAYESEVMWVSSNEAVASVQNGMVTAHDVGICTITVLAGSMEAICNVTVTETEIKDKIAGGKYKNITWEIDLNGKLSVEGTGEFSDSTETDRAPWSEYRRSVISAEINVSDMKDASYMFYDCSDLMSVNMKGFNTSSVTDMKYMFRNCCSLEELDLSCFDTVNVTDMRNLFYMCTNLRTLNLHNFRTTHIADMRDMFYMCTSLENLDLSSFDTRNVKYMDNMFGECKNLISLDLSNFDTHNVGGMRSMFYNCNSLLDLDLSSFDVSHVRMMDFMFYNCSSLVNLDISNFSTDNVTDMDCMFYGCSNLTELDLSGFHTSKVKGTDMSKMFYGCNRLSSLDLSSFDTKDVTYMGYMFSGCGNLTDLNLSSFDTRNVTFMGGMFDGCSKLANLNLYSFDTGSVTYMGYMFRGCSSLTSLDLSSFDLCNMTYAESTVDGCDSLETIYTPYHLGKSVELPGKQEDIWYQPDGAEIAELPQNLDHSIMITKNQVPAIKEAYISATKMKMTYMCGDSLNTDDLIVKYHNSDGSVKKITDYSTNADEIDMSVLGKKELIITYQNLTAVVPISVGEKIPVKEKVTIYADIVDTTYTGGEADCCKSVSVISKDGIRLTDNVTLTYTYGGTQADGSVYEDCTKAPVNAGRYFVAISVSDREGKYTGNIKYRFEIGKVTLRIRAANIKLGTGEPLPNNYKYDVEGFINDDVLLTEPSLNCAAVAIVPGVYNIMLQGADAGMNYEIIYIKGRLYIADDSDVLPEDIPDNDKIPEGIWIAGLRDYTYTGKAIKQSNLRVYDYKKLLQAGKDYTVTYKNNIKANDGSEWKTAPVVNIKGKGNYTGTCSAVFKILPVNLSDVMTEDITVAYNSKVQKKIPILKYNGKKLVNNKDFVVSYPAMDQELPDAYKAADCYVIVATAKPGSNFTGEKKMRLIITDRKLMSKVSVKKIPSQVYDGISKKPKLTVFIGKKTLVDGVDYKAEYINNLDVGTASVILSGIGAYTGTKKVTFKITGTSIKGAVITGLEDRQYNGRVWEPEITVTHKGKHLLKNTDYKVSYTRNNEAGKAMVVVEGIGAYTGIIKKSFRITAYDIENIEGQLSQDITCKYLKGGSRPKVVLNFAGKALKEGVDYTVSYRNNKSVTTAETRKLPNIIIKGKGNFKGSITKNFCIVSRALDDEEFMVNMTAADIAFVDKPGRYMSRPVLIDADGKKLIQGVDYEKQLIYTLENNNLLLHADDKLNAGSTVIVTAQGKGAYSGRLSARYRITEKSFNQARIKIKPQVYTGNEIILSETDNNTIRVSIGKKVLTPGVDYEIVKDSYENNIKKGTATVKVTGKGSYGGSKTVAFKIVSKQIGEMKR